VWVETPSNPALFVTDIASVAECAHAKGVPLLVDNTTATAALQQPLELGADIVLLSITKFLCGNATVLGGAIVGPEALIEDVRWNTTEFIGAVLQPFEAWLTLQFLETLPLRMQRHSENAQRVAEFLANHARVEHVNYPGLTDHPQYELAKRQMRAGGGMLSFVASGGIEGAGKMVDQFKLITHAVTFGTSRTICMHPATITHEHMTTEEREKAGIPDGLIRLSVGLEDVGDLITDLDQALAG
jgi:cystathionine beta-lyase/cystathionine gamma-synthase